MKNHNIYIYIYIFNKVDEKKITKEELKPQLGFFIFYFFIIKILGFALLELFKFVEKFPKHNVNAQTHRK